MAWDQWFGVPEHGKKFARLYNTSAAFRHSAHELIKDTFKEHSSLVKIVIDKNTGQPMFAVTKGSETQHFSSPDAARRYANDPLRSIQKFTGRQTQKRFLQPGVGSYYSEHLEAMAAKMQGTFIQETYHTSGNKDFEYVFNQLNYEPGKGADGIFNVKEGKIHVLKFIPSGETKPLNSDKLLERMSKELGMEMRADAGAVFKRLNTLTSPRAYGISDFDNAVNLRIGYYTHDNLMQSYPKGSILAHMRDSTRRTIASNPNVYGADVEQAMQEVYKIGTEGQFIMPKRGLDPYIDNLTARLNHYQSLLDAAKASGNVNVYHDLSVRVKGTRKAIRKLQKVKSEGGSFNVRLISNTMGKGDVNVVGNKAFDRRARALGYNDPLDFLAHTVNQKDELKFIGGSVQTLELRQKVQPLRVGISESATFPGAIRQSLLSESFMDESTDILEEFRTGRSTAGSLRKMIKDILNLEPEDFASNAEFLEFRQIQTYAMNIKNMLDNNIPPASVDTMANQFMHMYEEHFLKYRKRRFGRDTRFGRDMQFHTTVRGGFRAEVSPAEELIAAMPQKMQGRFDLLKNSIIYSEESGRFGFTALNMFKTYPAAGGPDFDDSFGVIYRYDTRAKRLMGMVLRTPFEMGEYMYMDVDIHTMPGIDDVTRSFYRRRQEIIKRLQNFEYKYRQAGGEAERIKLINELNLLNKSIDERLASQFDNFDLLDEMNREFMAPKGHAFTPQSRADYERISITKSFHEVSDDMDEIMEALKYEARNAYTGSPFEFRGHNFNVFDQTYYNFIARDEAEKAAILAADPNIDQSKVRTIDEYRAGRIETTNAQAYTQDLVENARIRAEVADRGQGALGNFVNAKQMSEEIIENQLRDRGITTLDLPTLAREVVIDAVQKEADEALVETVRAATEDIVRGTTRFLIEQRKAGETFGFDPYDLETRMGPMRGFIEDEIRIANRAEREAAIAAGLDEAAIAATQVSIEDITLAPDDPRAQLATRVNQRIAEVEEMMTEAKRIANEESIGKIADNYAASAEELRIAKEFMDQYEDSLRAVREASAQDFIQQSMDEDAVPDTFFGQEEVNRRSNLFLREKGLFDEDAVTGRLRVTKRLENQMLALAKYAEQNKATLTERFGSAYAPMTTVSGIDEDSGIGRMFFASVNKERYRDTIATYNEQVTALRRMGDRKSQAYQDLLADTKQNFKTLKKAFPHFAEHAKDFKKPLKPLVFPRMREGLTVPSPGAHRVDGYMSALARQAADETSQKVSGILQQKFTRQGFRDMVGSIRGARAGLYGAAGLAAFGVLYGMKDRDRTPEDMMGPPLLPGGSAYEDYEDIEDFSTIYTSAGAGRGQFNPGILYQVNLTGRTDPAQLINSIQSITGSEVNSTIYNGRETVRSGNRNSRSILNERSTF